MKKIQKFLIIGFSFWITMNPFAQQRLTLSESVELGLKNSKDLKISTSKVRTSEANLEMVQSQFFPQLKFTANYTRLSDVPPFEVLLPFSPKPITIAQTILNNYTLKLSFQQPLFTGFRLIEQKRSTEHLKEAADYDYQKDKNEVAFGIKTAFWNYYKALEIKTVFDDNIKSIEKHLDDTKNLLNNGLATQNDVLKLEVQLSNTKLMLIDAENNIELARIVFNKTIGLPIEEKTFINPEEIQVKDTYNEYQSLRNEALSNRNEIKSTEKRIEAGEDNINANRSSFFPQVFLSGNYYLSRPNQRYQPPEDKIHGTWDLGITLIWDIWTWGNTSAQVKQAEENLLQTETLKKQLKENIELEVSQSYLSLKYTEQKIEVLEITIQEAEENLRITNERYEHQLATSTDLIDAENSVITAQTNYKEALADFEISKIKLEKALGRKLY